MKLLAYVVLVFCAVPSFAQDAAEPPVVVNNPVVTTPADDNPVVTTPPDDSPVITTPIETTEDPVITTDPQTPPPPVTTKEPPPISGASIFVDQDWFFVANSDRNYTMGIGLQATGPWFKGNLGAAIGLLDDLIAVGRLHEAVGDPFDRNNVATAYGALLAGAGYTPQDLTSVRPVRDDRPYSSILFLEATRATINVEKRRVLRSSLGLGFIGVPEVARTIQSEIHKQGLKNDPNYRPIPRGWHNQISNGSSEPSLLYKLSYAQEASRSPYHDLSWETGASAGWYTNAWLGGLLRVGLLQTDFWSTTSNPLSSGNQATDKKPDARKHDRDCLEVYAYVGSRVRLVGYNALLQGQFAPSNYTLAPDEIARVIAEGDLGVAASFWGLTAGVNALSFRTFDHYLSTRRLHAWGGIYVTYAF